MCFRLEWHQQCSLYFCWLSSSVGTGRYEKDEMLLEFKLLPFVGIKSQPDEISVRNCETRFRPAWSPPLALEANTNESFNSAIVSTTNFGTNEKIPYRKEKFPSGVYDSSGMVLRGFSPRP